MSPRQIKNTTIVLLIACFCMLLIAFISSCTTHANAIGIEDTRKTQAHEIAEQARDIEDTEYIEIPEEKLKEKVNEPKKEFVPEKQSAPEKKVNEPSFLSGVE